MLDRDHGHILRLLVSACLCVAAQLQRLTTCWAMRPGIQVHLRVSYSCYIILQHVTSVILTDMDYIQVQVTHTEQTALPVQISYMNQVECYSSPFYKGFSLTSYVTGVSHATGLGHMCYK